MAEFPITRGGVELGGSCVESLELSCGGPLFPYLIVLRTLFTAPTGVFLLLIFFLLFTPQSSVWRFVLFLGGLCITTL